LPIQYLETSSWSKTKSKQEFCDYAELGGLSEKLLSIALLSPIHFLLASSSQSAMASGTHYSDEFDDIKKKVY
jgi:hypothetical protein